MSASFRTSIVAAVFAVSLLTSSSAFSSSIVSGMSAEASTTEQFNRGDLVRLRSGGPLMTVGSIKDGEVDCFWSDATDQANDAKFPAYVLQKISSR